MNSLAYILEIPHNILLIPGPPDNLLLRAGIGAPFHSTMVSIYEETLIPLPRDVDE